jgi:hypothetical protein
MLKTFHESGDGAINGSCGEGEFMYDIIDIL